MSAEIFDFPFHRVNTVYPEAPAVRFGNNWMFTAKPNAPDQRTLQLEFDAGMQYFIVDIKDTSRGDVVTAETLILSGQRPRTTIVTSGKAVLPTTDEAVGQRNVLALEQFYQRHQMWDTFTYPHVVHGVIVCRFGQPFTSPKVLPKSNGVVASFTISLLEIP